MPGVFLEHPHNQRLSAAVLRILHDDVLPGATRADWRRLRTRIPALDGPDYLELAWRGASRLGM